MIYKGRGVSKGVGRGRALVTGEPISFLGGVDPDTGVITERNHELRGECISGKVFVFPHGKGSTVGTYIIYRLFKNGKAPVAMVNKVSEPIVAVGGIIAGIPLVDRLEVDPLSIIKNDMLVEVDGTRGTVTIFDDT